MATFRVHVWSSYCASTHQQFVARAFTGGSSICKKTRQPGIPSCLKGSVARVSYRKVTCSHFDDFWWPFQSSSSWCSHFYPFFMPPCPHWAQRHLELPDLPAAMAMGMVTMMSEMYHLIGWRMRRRTMRIWNPSKIRSLPGPNLRMKVMIRAQPLESSNPTAWRMRVTPMIWLGFWSLCSTSSQSSDNS